MPRAVDQPCLHGHALGACLRSLDDGDPVGAERPGHGVAHRCEVGIARLERGVYAVLGGIVHCALCFGEGGGDLVDLL